MIALARLVVIAKYAYSIANERKPVLETMARAADRARDLPDHDFDESTVVQHVPLVDQQLRLHVGANNNNRQMLSMTPTEAAPADDGSVPAASAASKALISRRFEHETPAHFIANLVGDVRVFYGVSGSTVEILASSANRKRQNGSLDSEISPEGSPAFGGEGRRLRISTGERSALSSSDRESTKEPSRGPRRPPGRHII